MGHLRDFTYTLAPTGENVFPETGMDINVAEYIEMECEDCGGIKTYFFEEIREDIDEYYAAYSCEGCSETFEFKLDEVRVD